MALYVAVMAGESARQTEPLFASSDPKLIELVTTWVKDALKPKSVSEILGDEGFLADLSPDARRAVLEGIGSNPDIEPEAA